MQFQFQYFKDPGVLIDTITVFALKLNPKFFWNSASVLFKNNPKEIDHLKKQVASFITPPKELLLFFYKPNEHCGSFMTHYVERMLCRDFSHTTLSSLYKKLKQLDLLKQELYSFYLPKKDATEANLLSLLRTNSTLPDNIKFYLLSFQLDPKSFCFLLVSWLKKYSELIEKSFLPLYQNFIPDTQTTQILIAHTYPDNSTSFATRPILYSLCSVLPDYLYIHSSVCENWIIAGYRFQEVVNAITQQKQTIDLQEIFEALGDSIRLQIINHLYSYQTSTRQQMIDTLSIPVTSSHHHLEKLKRAGLIISHRENNNYIYSLNFSIFKEIADIFKLYSQGGTSL